MVCGGIIDTSKEFDVNIRVALIREPEKLVSPMFSPQIWYVSSLLSEFVRHGNVQEFNRSIHILGAYIRSAGNLVAVAAPVATIDLAHGE